LYIEDDLLYIPIAVLKQENMLLISFLDEGKRSIVVNMLVDKYNAIYGTKYKYAGLKGILNGNVVIKVCL